MEGLMAAAVALFAGLMMTRLFKALHLNFPDVTAFLIAGLLVGPYGIGRLNLAGLGFNTLEDVEAVHAIIDAALGFIAFSIGSEFKMEKLRHIGKTAVVTGIFESVGACICVDIALISLHFILGEELLPMSVAVTLGAIAAATAPAATLMVVKQYKAEGPVTDLLLPIVALDDAIGLMVFAVSFGIAQALEGGELTVFTVLLNPLIEILCSILLGSLMGLIMSRLEKLFYSGRNRMAITISFVFFTIAVASLSWQVGPVKIAFSSLLVLMMLGTVFCNVSEFSADIFYRADRWTAPLFASFFVLSGAELDLSVLARPNVVLIGLVYVIIRMVGKYLGARIGTMLMKCSETVKKYLGITLFPQAGVALGMTVTAATLGGDKGPMIRNIVLFGVLLYELFGPTTTRMALTAAGEIKEKPEEKKQHQRLR